jgi:hypothetical protein
MVQHHGVSGLLAVTDGLKTDQPAPFPVHVSDCTQKFQRRLQRTCCCFLLAMVGGLDSCRTAACPRHHIIEVQTVDARADAHRLVLNMD